MSKGNNIKKKIITRIGVLILLPTLTAAGMTLLRRTPFQADSVKEPKKILVTAKPGQSFEITDLGYQIIDDVNSEVMVYGQVNEGYVRTILCTLNDSLINAELGNQIMLAVYNNDIAALKEILENSKVVTSMETRNLGIEGENNLPAPYAVANLYSEIPSDYKYRLQTKEEEKIDNEKFLGIASYSNLSAILIWIIKYTLRKAKEKQKVKEITR